MSDRIRSRTPTLARRLTQAHAATTVLEVRLEGLPSNACSRAYLWDPRVFVRVCRKAGCGRTAQFTDAFFEG